MVEVGRSPCRAFGVVARSHSQEFGDFFLDFDDGFSLAEFFGEALVLASQSFDRGRTASRLDVRSRIVVALASLSHATFMADSRKKYKYGILDRE